MSKKPYVSVVIPTLNEEKNIGRVIKSIRHVLSNYSYEIIVVDSSSTDRTVEVAKRLNAIVLNAPRGKGISLITGLNHARGDILISMDADLSNEPKELKLLIAGIEIGYDICMGSRFIIGGGSQDMPLTRRLGNKVFITLVNLFFRSNYTDLCYGYRSFRSSALKKLGLSERGFGIETEINIKAIKRGLKVLEVPSMEKRRASGEAKLKTFRDGYIILITIFKNLMV